MLSRMMPLYVIFLIAMMFTVVEARGARTKVSKKTHKSHIVDVYDAYIAQDDEKVIRLLSQHLNSNRHRHLEDQMYYLLALSYQAKGQMGNALLCWDRLIYQNTKPYYRMKAMVSKGDYHYKLSEYTHAKRLYEQVITLDVPVDDLDRVYLRLADIAMQSGEQDEAQRYWQQILKKTPTRKLQNKANALIRQLKSKVYSVQVGAFQTQSNARKLSLSLNQKGYDSYVVTSSQKGKTVYKVRVGRLKDKQAVERLSRKMKIQEQIKGSVVHDALVPHVAR